MRIGRAQGRSEGIIKLGEINHPRIKKRFTRKRVYYLNRVVLYNDITDSRIN